MVAVASSERGGGGLEVRLGGEVAASRGALRGEVAASRGALRGEVALQAKGRGVFG